MSEYKLHIAVVKHIQSAFPHLLWFHIPNQTRDATEAFFNKMMGVKAGASDLLIAWHGGQALIELKTKTGRLSNEQNRFLSAFRHIGWHTAVCRTVEDVHTYLCSWGLNPVHSTIIEPDLRTDVEKKADAFEFFAR